MSEKGPFEDAVYILGRYMDNRLRGKEAAIRVLEAAGKVDKEFIINHFGEVADHGCHWCRQIRVLLESLPDTKE